MKYRKLKHWKYQLLEDELFHLPWLRGYSTPDWDIPIRITPDGFLKLEAGYAWDGASGPCIDTPTLMRPSLLHDALYQAIRLGVLPREAREKADDTLRWRYLSEWVGWVLAHNPLFYPIRKWFARLRAGYIYWAVRLFGWRAIR